MTDQTPNPAPQGQPEPAPQGQPEPAPQGQPDSSPQGQRTPPQGQPDPSAQRPPHPAPAQEHRPPAAPPQSEATRLGTRAVAITATVLGAAGLLFGAAGSAYATVYDSVTSGSGDPAVTSTSTTGVTAVDIDHGFGELDIRFEGDGREATLVTEGVVAERIQLERDGKTLRLSAREDGLPFGNWSWIFGGWDDQYATLTLPESLAGVDLTVDSGAGQVSADGEFGAVDVEVGAGYVQVTGGASEATVDVSAGQAVLDLEDVRAVDAEVSAGAFFGTFSGAAPEAITIDLSAGDARIAVPDEEYDVRQEVSAGHVDTRDLRVSRDATRTIDATVSAGEVSLGTLDSIGS